VKKGFYIFSGQGETITLIMEGTPHVVPRDNPRYDELVAAIKADDWDTIGSVVLISKEFTEVLGAYGDVLIYAGHVMYQGRELEGFLVETIRRAVQEGLPLDPLGRFQQNVLENPDPRAQADLYKFCEKSGLPISDDGCIIAYKIVGDDYLDLHTHTLDNSVGRVVEMDRTKCDPDPRNHCSRGLHFCSAGYLPKYGGQVGSRVLLVKVHPRDVTAFPYDDASKARCCRYEVIEEVDRESAREVFGVKLYWAPPTHYHLQSPNQGFWKAPNSGFTDEIEQAYAYPADEAKALQTRYAVLQPVLIVAKAPAPVALLRDTTGRGYWKAWQQGYTGLPCEAYQYRLEDALQLVDEFDGFIEAVDPATLEVVHSWDGPAEDLDWVADDEETEEAEPTPEWSPKFAEGDLVELKDGSRLFVTEVDEDDRPFPYFVGDEWVGEDELTLIRSKDQPQS
jgi:hypothetical protein